MKIVSDLDRLDPVFRERVAEILRRMRLDGHDPKVHETYRSPARAAMLALVGRGTRKSMHCYGIAADIISESRKWSPPAAFWMALGHHAGELGLTWGGTWRKRDLPHVQAVPIEDQAYIRTATPRGIAARVRSRLT